VTVGDVLVVAFAAEVLSLGVVRQSRLLDDDERGTITAAAAQVSVSLENKELQQNRREIIRSYATRSPTPRNTNAAASLAKCTMAPPRPPPAFAVASSSSPNSVTTTTSPLPLARSAPSPKKQSQTSGAWLTICPHVLDNLSLLSAVEWLPENLSDRTTLNVRFNTSGEPCDLSGDQELGVFRIVQEALSNIENTRTHLKSMSQSRLPTITCT
jgi:hypothetical protein